LVLYSPAISPENLQQIAQLKGQILTLQEVAEPKEFLTDEDLEKLDESTRT